MARTQLPDSIQRREVLEQKLDPAKALKYAEAYLAQDRTVEALAFLAKGDARDRLETIREEAIASGDVFLLRETSLHLGEEADADAWRRLADAAAAAGKESYAVEARRQLTALEAI